MSANHETLKVMRFQSTSHRKATGHPYELSFVEILKESEYREQLKRRFRILMAVPQEKYGLIVCRGGEHLEHVRVRRALF